MSKSAAVEPESPVGATWEFLALATQHARAHDPTFPDLGELPMAFEDDFCRSTSHCEWSEGDRGANVSLTETNIGPAEVIHSDSWNATCWGADWGFSLRFERKSGAKPLCWREPYSRPR